MAGGDGKFGRPFISARLRASRQERLEAEQARAYGVPRSVFLGRVVGPGEPLFTEEDTAYALALAEEEAATCPSCGMLKVVCRDPAYQFGGFDAAVETCWATHRVAIELEKHADAHQATRAALQISPRYTEGREPALDVGLDLGADADEPEPSSNESKDE